VRIADILATHARPGTTVVDLTSQGEPLPPGLFPPDFGLTYTREPIAPSGVSLVLHDLPAADAENQTTTLDLGTAAAGVIHIVLFDRIEAPVRHGLLEQAARGGWELSATHGTRHERFHFVMVFAAAGDGQVDRLRLVNEYRYDKLALTLFAEQLERTEQRVGKARARANANELAKTEAEQRAAELQRELDARTAELDRAIAAAGRLRERIIEIEGRLAAAHDRLVEARTALGFRVDRATRAALDDSRDARGLLGAPRRWLSAFRGRDQVLADIDRDD
jgi:hypothetical protein